MATLNCPTCKRPFDSEQSRVLPFCSPRCRNIDLGKWLSEEYSVPVYRVPDEDEQDESPEEGPET